MYAYAPENRAKEYLQNSLELIIAALLTRRFGLGIFAPFAPYCRTRIPDEAFVSRKKRRSLRIALLPYSYDGPLFEYKLAKVGLRRKHTVPRIIPGPKCCSR